jgi:pyruvate dehydrogenase E2 component (dihydrolipoamide acetyltransferase)
VATTVTMPQLGETVTEGTILRWAKKVGDSVAVDEVLVEISTDKVDTEVPSPAAGVVTELLVGEGETVAVGTALATIGDAGEAPAAAGEAPAGEAPADVRRQTPDASPEPAAEAATTAEAAPQPAPAAPEAAPQPAPAAPEPVTPEAAPEPAAAPVAPKPAEPAQPAEPAATAPAPSPSAPAAINGQASTAEGRAEVLSPVVRKLVREHGVDLNAITGTGEGGRITRRDIESHLAGRPEEGAAAAAPVEAPPAAPQAPAPQQPAPAPEPPTPDKPAPATPAPAAPAPATSPQPAVAPPPVRSSEAPAPMAPPVPVAATGTEEVPLDRLRTRIAENLVRAKQTAAHVWTSVEVDYERVERVRIAHQAAWKKEEGFSLTYLPFIARATIDALKEYPVVNSSFFLDEKKAVFHRSVNLGIAIDLDQKGLVVATIRNADGLRLVGLARRIRELAEKARAGKLEPDDVTGSTFSITNPGPFGSFLSAPIINVPNTGLLSTETIAKRPAVVTTDEGQDTIAIRHIGYLGFSWDHRAFDGSTAVLFLQRIKQNLENWDWNQELA